MRNSEVQFLLPDSGMLARFWQAQLDERIRGRDFDEYIPEPPRWEQQSAPLCGSKAYQQHRPGTATVKRVQSFLHI